MSGTLLIINDPPYGTERAYNALRLARALVGKDGETVRTVFAVGLGLFSLASLICAIAPTIYVPIGGRLI